MSTEEGPVLSRRVLDSQMRELNQDRERPWGVWPWLGPVLTLVVLIAGLQLVAREVHPHGSAVATAGAVAGIVGDAVLLAALLFFGRDIAAATGGWRQTFGLQAPTALDVRPWLLGVVIVFVGRFAVGATANHLSHGKAVHEASNLRVHGLSSTGEVLLIVATVIVAPLVEELMFRGLLLRTFMRRLPFWPAALLSSVVFAAFHSYEVKTLAGAATLTAFIFVLALTNCLLVRATGRLTPGMLVHASFNVLAVLVVIHTNR